MATAWKPYPVRVVAAINGFNLHTNVAINGFDRATAGWPADLSFQTHLERRHDGCCLRAAGFHGKTGSFNPSASGPFDSLSKHPICAIGLHAVPRL